MVARLIVVLLFAACFGAFLSIVTDPALSRRGELHGPVVCDLSVGRRCG